ncbi:class II fructose-bisphosphate aldolase [Streptomyces flaveolus]|uniref:Class II fructose-bisphosphate aldolase n=1 Tax=Streptomyces flaveolus TaxID=67297 RepID=A0ABV1VJX8_9ACTN
MPSSWCWHDSRTCPGRGHHVTPYSVPLSSPQCATPSPVPLVLHGSSGVGDADLIKAVAGGMTKINTATHLDAAFTEAVRCALRTRATSVDPRHHL